MPGQTLDRRCIRHTVRRITAAAKVQGGADDGIYGSQRQTTRRTNDSVDKDPNGFEAGLRASGERFALIFSQLDELSLNSRLGRPDAAKSSASSETTAPSTGAGAVSYTHLTLPTIYSV